MKIIDLTIDNCFRNPIRWRRCPVGITNERIYGLYIKIGEDVMMNIKKRWVVIIYFHKWYKAWSNYPFFN